MKSKENKKEKNQKSTLIESLITRKQPVVHATFRLSQEAHKAIKELGDYTGEKNAELFERLLKYFDVMKTLELPVSFEEPENKATVRKTYVVKKDTVTKLSNIAKEHKKSRDLIVERAAMSVSEITSEALLSQKELYSLVLKKTINPLLEQAEDEERQLGETLGRNDPVVLRFSTITTILMNLSMAIESYLKKNAPIDPNDTSQQS